MKRRVIMNSKYITRKQVLNEVLIKMYSLVQFIVVLIFSWHNESLDKTKYEYRSFGHPTHFGYHSPFNIIKMCDFIELFSFQIQQVRALSAISNITDNYRPVQHLNGRHIFVRKKPAIKVDTSTVIEGVVTHRNNSKYWDPTGSANSVVTTVFMTVMCVIVSLICWEKDNQTHYAWSIKLTKQCLPHVVVGIVPFWTFVWCLCVRWVFRSSRTQNLWVRSGDFVKKNVLTIMMMWQKHVSRIIFGSPIERAESKRQITVCGWTESTRPPRPSPWQTNSARRGHLCILIAFMLLLDYIH